MVRPFFGVQKMHSLTTTVGEIESPEERILIVLIPVEGKTIGQIKKTWTRECQEAASCQIKARISS
jgi:hypothetical protein